MGRDDCLRSLRMLLREIVRNVKHDMNFHTFALSLMHDHSDSRLHDLDPMLKASFHHKCCYIDIWLITYGASVLKTTLTSEYFCLEKLVLHLQYSLTSLSRPPLSRHPCFSPPVAAGWIFSMLFASLIRHPCVSPSPTDGLITTCVNCTRYLTIFAL